MAAPGPVNGQKSQVYQLPDGTLPEGSRVSERDVQIAYSLVSSSEFNRRLEGFLKRKKKTLQQLIYEYLHDPRRPPDRLKDIRAIVRDYKRDGFLRGEASFYGKYDGTNGPGQRDDTSCHVTSKNTPKNPHKFNPHKLQIASREFWDMRDIIDPKREGIFVYVTLTDSQGKPILDDSNRKIVVPAEVIDWGPAYKTNRRFDLSYGIKEHFESMAEGVFSKGDVHVKIELADLDHHEKLKVRAITIRHKITGENIKSEHLACLKIRKINGEMNIVSSDGDNFVVGWNPADYIMYMPFDDNSKRAMLTMAYFVASDNLSDSSVREVAKRAREARFKIEKELGIPRSLIHLGSMKYNGKLYYWADIGPFTPNQIFFIYEALQGWGNPYVPTKDGELESLEYVERSVYWHEYVSHYMTLPD